MPLQIPHPNTPLHLYRHLLREATYLPLLCRPWITDRIQSRFRDCRQKTDPKPHIKDAHHYLRYLRSANIGHVNRMLRLCRLAAGRVGKRRRILGRTELSSSPPSNSDELEERITLPNGKSREPDWLDNWSVEKVMAIATSQSQQEGKNLPFNMRRTVDPKKVIPKENCFGRPLTAKLARNKLKKHWISILRQLLPPLPRGEWDQLGTIARGEADAQYYKMPPRRQVAQPLSISHAPPESTWTDFVTKPIRSLERGNSRKMKSLSGREDEDPRGHGRPIGIRVLGRRRLRRSLYIGIWQASPIAEKHPRSGKWSITWGNSEQPVPRPRKKDLQFFQGINKAGVPI
ncbi:hypothetical protein F4813DRAFT_393327 [Daldinia decipiens]|uniref:uncharacterized protein n=1 Tax=Daldinia decipiens TaxID=326647 RepID=UPI0020C3BEC9|nr:uncharacterized protein F4813DRAFT_393327 [Daldinia decipiens]KAI1653742.1 hypothetical protein F4813DRAFT_393327 [Daldinia decipiens]